MPSARGCSYVRKGTLGNPFGDVPANRVVQCLERRVQVEIPADRRPPTDKRVAAERPGMSPRSPRERNVLVAVAAVGLLVLVYSFLIAGNLLAGLDIVVPLLLLYLVWRFVRAHERVADALEARSDGPDDRPG